MLSGSVRRIRNEEGCAGGCRYPMIRITQKEQLGRQLFSGKFQVLIGFLGLFIPFPLKFLVLAALLDHVVAIQAR